MDVFKISSKLTVSIILFFIICTLSTSVFARGGGGGSGGGGGGGSGGGSSHSGSAYTSESVYYRHGDCFSKVKDQTEAVCKHNRSIFNLLISLIFPVSLFVIFFPIYLFSKRVKKEQLRLSKTEQTLSSIVKNIYFQFQKAWSEFDVDTLKKITSKRFHQQLVLELSVLKNENRENKMDNVALAYAYVNPNKYKSTESLTMFKAEISGSADDSLFDTKLQKQLYLDDSAFFENWTLILEDGVWKLDAIDPSTSDSSSVRKGIVNFALKNNFFYNPDFGWLMIPNRGDLFSSASFETSDVNNHVIGTYKNKIVEFYSIIFKEGGEEYFIGQAILPRSYNRIVIRHKNKFSFITRDIPGLRKIELESVVFNEEFDVYSDNADTLATFELLHPAYMEYIMGLPFKVSIEVVDNILYFYTTSEAVDYNKLLEILSRAFDEIKE